MHSVVANWCVRRGMCAAAGRGPVQRGTTSDGTLACGYSRSGVFACRVRPEVRTLDLQSGDASSIPAHGASTRSLRRAHASGAEIGRKDGAAPEPVTGWNFSYCLVNSAARVPACLAGSRGLLALRARPSARCCATSCELRSQSDPRTRRQIEFAKIAQRVERRIEGACVGGSKPSLGTSKPEPR